MRRDGIRTGMRRLEHPRAPQAPSRGSGRLSEEAAEAPELQHEPVTVGVGPAEAAAPEKEPPAAASIPTAIKYQDDNSLAHPNLFIEKAEAEEKWFQRLVALRQERLMGSPVA
ncbi:serine/Arginine-related protein 53 [Willisornis vidua]|uniref:Serine/Arginine-related protein 53 n=1 Tax=Willisornis vidua TaxID=1566151 RepID=A0ABQ9DJF4_9PASS|nr:serine/Arginine-related protein 53 [Willisornis vidua]